MVDKMTIAEAGDHQNGVTVRNTRTTSDCVNNPTTNQPLEIDAAPTHWRREFQRRPNHRNRKVVISKIELSGPKSM